MIMDITNIFTVTPMSHEINLSAGEVYTGSVTVVNPVDAVRDFNYKVVVSPYAVIDDDYTADFATQSERTQIADWITIDEPTGTVAPNSSRKVNFTITVPETAPAGGQYAALMVSANTDAESGSGVAVNNIFEMASIIYANIAGETIRDGDVLENNIPGFVAEMPIKVSAMLQNNGNSHEIARVSLEVSSFFAATPIYPSAGDSGTLNEVVMPGTTYYATRDITGLSPLGIYTVTQTIDYLGERYQRQQVVVACPLWFMALVAITIAAVVAGIAHRVKIRKRRYNTI